MIGTHYTITPQQHNNTDKEKITNNTERATNYNYNNNNNGKYTHTHTYTSAVEEEKTRNGEIE